ncbi:hypothetical protein [Ulvibacterium marinum]|uniref:hypothetical protein n=1 Tax=Ulvibacterium marinum TaxID=2419782 RepID=UPI0024945B76|nr:hypothetical protein [Ulvibacterium marinum]
MKAYKNLDEINLDLKRLSLERQIALEEMKGLKTEVRHDLRPYNWIYTALSMAKEYGVIYLVRKVFR